jgi:hypothetical protein
VADAVGLVAVVQDGELDLVHVQQPQLQLGVLCAGAVGAVGHLLAVDLPEWLLRNELVSLRFLF